MRPGSLLFWLAVRRPERYRLRAPASGRESVVSVASAFATTENSRVTGERLDVVGKLVPTSASPSTLPRAPEFLRVCPHCEELVGRDLSDCPYCRRRMPALARQP